MNYTLEQLQNGLYRICIPFEDIYTTAFVITDGDHCLLYDSGSNGDDADNCVLPALKELGLSPDVLLCSHFHGDHSGGLSHLSRAYPEAETGSFADPSRYKVNHPRRLADGETLFGRYTVLNLKGHTEDGLALYDTVDGVLITGDCLQGGRVGRFGLGISDPDAYRETLHRLRTVGAETLYVSHDYFPLGYCARGREAVLGYLDGCLALLEERLAQKRL